MSFPIAPRVQETSPPQQHHLFSPLFAAAATSTRHHHCLRRCFLLCRYLPPLLLHSLEKDEQQDAHGEARRRATQTEKRQDNTDDGVQVAIAFHHRVAFQIYYYITTSASASPSCSGSASCAHLHLYVGFQICRCVTGVVSPSLPLQSSNGSCSLRKCTKNRKGKNGYIINGWGWVEERKREQYCDIEASISPSNSQERGLGHKLFLFLFLLGLSLQEGYVVLFVFTVNAWVH
ncbi:hypothetical protein PIB30_020346 [Stylosanthes scabra]|uniref:Uncharacterized protein n=1 Tax=Stylosanthes scabra TaxID=79078 RepID=A0ABU6Z852_9FABA|nr:hypothetical protein [Stylosanthes scabra]